MLFRTDFSIIALIGVIMLIGIVQKNAIMMIDFALAAERSRDVPPRDAIFEACLLRFRPILMTTLSALLAAIPLALGRGDGAELRQPLGIAIGGGLILSQLLTLYTTPIVYLYLDRLSDRARSAATARATRAAPGFAPQTGGSRRNDAAVRSAVLAHRRDRRRGRRASPRAPSDPTTFVPRPTCRPRTRRRRKRGRGTAERARRAAAGGSSTAIPSSMRSSRRSCSTTRRFLPPKRACGRRRR